MIVLDTHAWVWLRSDPGRLTPNARSAIADAEAVGVSAMSAWEVATLARRGRIVLDRGTGQWIREALHGMQALEINVVIGAAAGSLPDEFGGDPADRLIYATAVASGSRLVTADRRIRAFDPPRAVW